MSDQTFEQLWKRLLVYAPDIPVTLAQEFINTAYSRALSYCWWMGLRGRGQFFVPAPYNTGTISLTQDSTSVVGSGTTFTSAMVGRQLVVSGKSPYYDIASVESATALTLSTAYKGATESSLSYSIEQNVVDMPSDFDGFRAVVDKDNNWRLHTRYSEDQISAFDPSRRTTGNPYLIAPYGYTSAGLRRYEIWPRGTGAKLYSYTYTKKLPLLSAGSDKPIFPLRGDILRKGALAELSMWPGLARSPNPYYNIANHRELEKEFWRAVYDAEREDQNMAQTNITYAQENDFPFVPVDTNFLQSHGIVF